VKGVTHDTASLLKVAPLLLFVPVESNQGILSRGSSISVSDTEIKQCILPRLEEVPDSKISTFL
jgi:hypothetical protein